MSKFSRATGWIVSRRWLSCLIVILISSVAVGGYIAPDGVIQFFKSLVEREEQKEDQDHFDRINEIYDEEDYEAPPAVQTLNVTGFELIVVAESDDFFTPSGSHALRSVVERLESLDYVASVFWMDDVPPLNIFGLSEPIFPPKEAVQKRFDIAKEKALKHPLVNGQLLSPDGRVLMLMIDYDTLFMTDDRPFKSGLREICEDEARKHPEVKIDFLITGSAPVYLAVVESHEANQLKYQAIAYGMILLLSAILFRGAVAVGVVALAPVFGVFWTMGFIRYFEFQLNPFNDVVLPVLVALVCFTDGVHLMIQIRRERVGGLDPFKAAQEGLRKVGLACFLTSLTTAVGFGSLSLANNELVREFGYCCVIGVTLSFISVILTIPLACSTWLGQRIHKGHGDGFVDKNIGRISHVVEYVLKNRGWVSVVGIALSITCFCISLSLRPDEKQADVLPPSSEPARALRKLDTAMGGLQTCRILIDWDKDVSDPTGGKELLTVLGEIDQLLKREELIASPLSLFNMLAAMPGDDAVESRQSMIDLLPPPLKRSYYTPEFRTAEVQFRVQDLGIASYGPVFQRIEDGLNEIVNRYPGFYFDLRGEPIWKWRNIYQIVVDLATSLGTAAIIIFIILSLVYRSLRVGIISIMPNLFPLCVAGTYLVFTGQMLEIVTVCAFTCCLGIAVDDTIHFLTRYVEEKRETDDDSEAIRKAFTAVGTALVITTLVLVSGFLTVLFSETREHRIFASMGAITVATALFGDLVFLPAVLARFGKKPEKRNKTSRDE